jgi:Domain of unknown function (DUF4350)
MRERLVLLALAACAFAAFYALFVPKPAPGPSPIPRPLSSERRPDGYLALWQWLRAARVPEKSLRYRYDRLPALVARPTGNLLLVTLPEAVPARPLEIDDVDRWVARGNTLLVVAALDDTPIWSAHADPAFLQRIEQMTGLQFTPRKGAAGNARRLELAPAGPHALLAGVEHVIALSPLPASRWSLGASNGILALGLAKRVDDGDAALWLERRGAGQIIVCAAGSVFSNAGLALGDNARLLTNILGWSLGPSGTVIFDDAHQGQTAFYDAKAFFADPRLHRTLGWIVLLWLVFVLGPLPLRATRSRPQPLDETAYVEASARYLAAVVPERDAARRLIENFLEKLRERLSLGDEGAALSWLDRQARVSPARCRELRACYARALAGERVDLTATQNLLVELQRSLP